MPSEDTLYDLTTELRALGGGRVWSLMVSLFGDLAQGKGDAIAGPVLSAIMAALDVRPEAARVALHRLRNDGWIISAKAGRISHHSLSEEGRAKSREASPRIYTSAQAGQENWQIVMLNPDIDKAAGDMTTRGFIPMLPNIYAGAADLTAPADAAVFAGGAVPSWMRAMAIPSGMATSYAKLADVLGTLTTHLPEPAQMSPLNIAVLRCLVVHNWRRLVLKHPTPPRGLVDPDGDYHTCLTLVADLLARYPRPRLQDIAQD